MPHRGRPTMSEDDILVALIVEAVKNTLTDLEQRSKEALKALEKRDYAVALGALSGMEAQIQHVSSRLMILYEVQQRQKQKRKLSNRRR
jgi:hypothetical protein